MEKLIYIKIIKNNTKFEIIKKIYTKYFLKQLTKNIVKNGKKI